MNRADIATQAAFAAALLDPSAPVPAGLVAWNGADPGPRFAVHRNNVVHGLVAVLADTFPVVHSVVGAEFFTAMARRFITRHPPNSPLMHRYGEGFPGWLDGFEPAARPACLPDLARLELARLRAFHAADSHPLAADRIARALQVPDRLAGTALRLAPCLSLLVSAHPVVSLWRAHQADDAERDRQLATIDLGRGEAALVFRTGDDALVLDADAQAVALTAQLAAGVPLGPALAAHPSVDLGQVLGRLLQHGLVVGLRAPRARPLTPTPQEN